LSKENNYDKQNLTTHINHFLDKKEARLAPGSGLLYSGDEYSGTDETPPCQTAQTFQTKPSVANPKANKPKYNTTQIKA
jgi:hypothetical protein